MHGHTDQRHLTINVHGKVQGVNFRTSAKDKADELGLKGFIQNMPEGHVYIEIEGDSVSLHKFLDWCIGGPDLAEVEEIKTQENHILKHFDSFEIKY